MKLDIFDIQKFIDINKLEEVTNTVTFDYNKMPTNDGIMSNTIFGIQGSKERKTTFAYIDLKKRFFHPVIYKALTAMDRRIISIVDGSKYFIVKNGDLVEDEENGNTGIKWLYSVWEDIKFKSTGSSRRDDKISVFESLDKNEVFCDKFLVIPPFFRDVNVSKSQDGIISLDTINSMYVKLIGLCQSADSEWDFMGYLTELKIQNLLVEIYTFLTGALAKKSGMIKHNLMGKTVDYSTRGVISAPRVNSQTYKDQLIKFGYSGLPISHMCNLFFPFFVYEIRNILEEKFQALKIGESEETFEKAMDDYTPDKIEKMISLYIKSPDSRFTPLTVTSDSGKVRNLTFEYSLEQGGKSYKKLFTLLDLMYITAVRIAVDKYVYITRYPIETYQSICPCRITVTSTYKTTPIISSGTLYKDYPLIVTEKEQKSTRFIDTIMMHSTMLEAYGVTFGSHIIVI